MTFKRAFVVTLFNSGNCGAYLQAYALGKALRDRSSVPTRYVDTGARSVSRAFRSAAKQAVKRFDFPRLRFEYVKHAKYTKALERLEACDPLLSYDAGDLIVFGSDEIWNVGRKAISDYPMLWGAGISGGAKVSYAPSANGADFNAFSDAASFASCLREFQLLSARDVATAASVSSLIDREVEVVCDPTLLLGADDYRCVQAPVDRNGYVLVYSYGDRMTQADRDEIRAFAQSRNLKLISAGNWLPWCDESVPCGPFGFLGLYDAADYVITDTFHGSVFSLIFEKEFATYGRSNSKVLEFLRAYRLEGRDVSRGEGLSRCLGRPVSWGEPLSLATVHRERSMEYLDKALSGVVD